MSCRLILAWGCCAAAAAAGITILVSTPSPRIPPSLPAPAAVLAPPAAGTRPAAAPVPRAVPTWITIPSVGVSAPVAPTGLDASGALQLPPLTAGNLTVWWDGGPAPGQDGPAVIAGHVDSARGPLVFWRLRDLRPGDRIIIGPGHLVFTVSKVTQAAKAAFPQAQVYGPVPDPELRLITCGGPFDTASGHYLDNVIAFARETARSQRPGHLPRSLV